MNNDIQAALRYLEDMCRRSHDEWAEHKLAIIKAKLEEQASIIERLGSTEEGHPENWVEPCDRSYDEDETAMTSQDQTYTVVTRLPAYINSDRPARLAYVKAEFPETALLVVQKQYAEATYSEFDPDPEDFDLLLIVDGVGDAVMQGEPEEIEEEHPHV